MEVINDTELNKNLARNTTSDETFELAKDIAKHIVNRYDMGNENFDKVNRIEFLKTASDIRGFLKDSTKAKKVEDRLYEDYHEEIEKNGVYTANIPYFRNLNNIGNKLHDYNLDLTEKINLKKVFFEELQNKDDTLLKKTGYSFENNLGFDNFGNFIVSRDENFMDIVGTKNNLVDYLNSKLNSLNDIINRFESNENKMDIINIQNIFIPKIEKDIKELQDYKDDEILSMHLEEYQGTNYNLYHYIKTDDETLDDLQNTLYDVLTHEEQEIEEDEEEE